MDFYHESVLLKETIESLNIKEDGIYLDGTVGGGGHSSEILKKLGQKGLLIGLDQDIAAINKSQETLSQISDNYKLFKTNYENFEEVLDSLNIEKIDGFLLDLGVSSFQFDKGDRGFSYKVDAKLDMRMNQDSSFSAYDIVNGYSKEEISKILWDYADEKWANRIAEFIVNARKTKKITTTFELVEIIKNAIPASARRKKGHPAKKTFQALRIETNNEINILRNTLDRMIDRLRPQGRICVISFHSLEDRIVKDTFRYKFLDCICPKEAPVCVCDKEREINIITRKPITPSEEELKNNNRSHSAKLRVAEKI
ncbi:16S rRNA (cytosine(1402)-N(4))-methyltransferase RsmH [Peptoniphilus catoniae]|uniref:16S rRNA (cytosine(1402)-N(4))-methyltransferase RsmH n=1 Tax=Peptoniphilus catoniae TaxID=1660341 RepID=UPI0010FF2B51|nr:16S rRNA (cytosine(1402)-N(4))-methyltransferase RsmH [Peptoniphilus catoniae]